jgi:transglutaminase/protease-like cytokinesis protein 3
LKPGGRFAQITPDDPPWVVQFKQTLGSNWYTIKLYDVYVGRTEKERRLTKINDSIVFQIHNHEELLLQVYGTTNKIQKTETKTFAFSYPYHLLSYDYVEHSGINERSLHIEQNTEGAYDVIAQNNGQRLSSKFPGLPYSLKDELELEMWASSASRIKEHTFINHFLQLVGDVPIIGRKKATVRDIREEDIDGGKRTVISVEVSLNGDGAGYMDFDDSGRMRFMTLLDQYQYRIEETRPEPPIGAVDLYVHNMVPITQKIGNPANLKRLYLTLEGRDTKMFESGATQRVAPTENPDQIRVVIDTGEPGAILGQPQATSTTQFTRSVSREFSVRQEIGKMAKEAVGESILTEERIERLVRFVDEYIQDEYTFNSNLHQLIQGKKGDCSEHALLLSALARSLGIPCREVMGLVYLGDWCQGFGLHAWNEVYLDGRWKAVDASIGSSTIFPIYIRFPDDPLKRIQLMNSIHRLKIDIDKTELIDEKITSAPQVPNTATATR